MRENNYNILNLQNLYLLYVILYYFATLMFETRIFNSLMWFISDVVLYPIFFFQCFFSLLINNLLLIKIYAFPCYCYVLLISGVSIEKNSAQYAYFYQSYEQSN